MNWFVKWGVKKYVVGLLNDLIKKYGDNVQLALGYVDLAINKANSVMKFLTSLREKLADNQISDTEADEIIEEGTKLVSEIVG